MERRTYILSVICDDWRSRCYRVRAFGEIEALGWAHEQFGERLLDAEIVGEAASDRGFDTMEDHNGARGHRDGRD